MLKGTTTCFHVMVHGVLCVVSCNEETNRRPVKCRYMEATRKPVRIRRIVTYDKFGVDSYNRQPNTLGGGRRAGSRAYVGPTAAVLLAARRCSNVSFVTSMPAIIVPKPEGMRISRGARPANASPGDARSERMMSV